MPTGHWSYLRSEVYDLLPKPVKLLLHHRVGYRMGNESKAEAKAAIWDGQSEKGETVAGGTYFYQL